MIDAFHGADSYGNGDNWVGYMNVDKADSLDSYAGGVSSPVYYDGRNKYGYGRR